jgi:hypothetical protein
VGSVKFNAIVVFEKFNPVFFGLFSICPTPNAIQIERPAGKTAPRTPSRAGSTTFSKDLATLVSSSTLAQREIVHRNPSRIQRPHHIGHRRRPISHVGSPNPPGRSGAGH